VREQAAVCLFDILGAQACLAKDRLEESGPNDLARVHRDRESAGSRGVHEVYVAAAGPSDPVPQAFEPLNELSCGQTRQAAHAATSMAT